MSRLSVYLLLLVLLTACSPPGTLKLPDHPAAQAQRITSFDPSDMPEPIDCIHAGDTLRIVRDMQVPESSSEALLKAESMFLFVVGEDGSFDYPQAGRIEASGRTPEEISAEITQRTSTIYRDPQVTVNIVQAPGRRVIVAGAVHNPTSIDLAQAETAEQALFIAGGPISSADPHHVALIRLDRNGVYQIYFMDFSKSLISKQGAHAVVRLQHGDILFMPKSRVGNLADSVDLYITQLLPFFKGVVGNYQINEPTTSTTTTLGAGAQ